MWAKNAAKRFKIQNVLTNDTSAHHFCDNHTSVFLTSHITTRFFFQKDRSDGIVINTPCILASFIYSSIYSHIIIQKEQRFSHSQYAKKIQWLQLVPDKRPAATILVAQSSCHDKPGLWCSRAGASDAASCRNVVLLLLLLLLLLLPFAGRNCPLQSSLGVG